ncbi:hypothetical protein Ciccas_011944 [Cichlidogyrus casuarinus]|uniref:G-protein coupled receptors family 1 profile domain-containing protein n=1 Tax=Cichlidogyrus casuarinus TaxID=1844966 RepID=A0ABD2PPU0_9PLAT
MLQRAPGKTIYQAEDWVGFRFIPNDDLIADLKNKMDCNSHSVSNYLIMSLAVADLLVGALVMPVSALVEISKKWWLGLVLCDIWICNDVLLCTASILHLVAIAIDRFQAVTNVTYLQTRSSKKIIAMIAACWIGGVIISIPARFHPNREKHRQQVTIGKCELNSSTEYTIFSTLCAFYIPFIFMVCIYAKIWQTARERIRKKKFQAKQRKDANGVLAQSEKVPLEASVTCGCCYGKYKKIWRANIWTNCRLFNKKAPKTNGPINYKRNSSHVTYGAVAAGIRMASAIMTTTKSDPNKSYTLSELAVHSNRKISTRNSSSESSDSDSTSKIPLSYSILFKHLNQTEAQVSEDAAELIPKSIEYVDAAEIETVSSGEASPSRSCSQSRNCSMDYSSSKALARYSIIRGIRGPKAENQQLSSNFMTLAAYKKRQKQMRWIKRQHELEKTAIEAMGMIVFDEQSFGSVDDDLSPRERIEQKRERKAARTLAIITGCFLLCWLPFSLNSLLWHLTKSQLDPSGHFDSIILWLGYINSLLNPVIYTIFAPDFRNAFRKILFGRYRRNK